MTDPTSKTAELWSAKADPAAFAQRRFTSWMEHPVISQKYINRRMTGRDDQNWLNRFRNTHVPTPLNLCASLGCGSGGLERHALAIDICSKFDAFDVAAGAIETAKSEAAAMGFGLRVNYQVCDLNTIVLAPQTYDAVFACQSAHHFDGLEHIFDQVHAALRPGGFFVLNEFVGPTRFQWTDQQLDLVNGLLAILPARYRRLIADPSQIRDRLHRPTVEEMISYDPSEAVRSSELMSQITQRFEVVEKIEFGGTILQLLLQDIAGNFVPESEEDMAILDLICLLESKLIESKALPSDFVYLVTRPK
jgi:SAM-dependent methyltransferase